MVLVTLIMLIMQGLAVEDQRLLGFGYLDPIVGVTGKFKKKKTTKNRKISDESVLGYIETSQRFVKGQRRTW